MQLCCVYGVTLHWPFDFINKMQWSTPLPPLQILFRRGRTFRKDDQEWESAGIAWDKSRKDYVLYYFPASSVPPTYVGDDQIERTYFISRPGHQDSSISEGNIEFLN